MLDMRRNTLVQLFICGDIAVLNSFAEYLFPNLECLLLRAFQLLEYQWGEGRFDTLGLLGSAHRAQGQHPC